MPRVFIYPYKQGSQGARNLARDLGARLIRLNGSRYAPRRDDVIINWGNTNCPFPMALNASTAVASNKATTLSRLSESDVLVPPFTTNKQEAEQWVRDGHSVLARTILNGSEGRGIVFLEEHPEVQARLFTRYVKKKKEFRVHVMNGEVIRVQEKRRRNGGEASKIRSYNNGYVFCVNDINEPEHLREIAIRAVGALGLDFGAVDIIWNQRENQCYVLEVNTAPGNEEATSAIYASAIRRHFLGAQQ